MILVWTNHPGLKVGCHNAYLKAHGVEVNNFKFHSTTFLTVE
jgi:hypothetical protein